MQFCNLKMLGNIRQRDKNVKTCTDYNGDIENEPEEGEIVDNYELISSDEEFVMRQRIEELEAKNKEIEKIAVISRSYPSEYHYAKIQSCSYNQLNKDYWRKSKHDIAARVPKDVSSISSIEYEVSRRSSKRRRSRDGKRKPNHHNHCRNHSKRRKRRCRHTCSNESGRHKHRREFNYSMEAIDLHTESSNSLHSVTYVNEGTIDGPNQIDRDSLRFAVARSIHNSQLKEDTMGSLSKRLLEQPKKGNSDDEDIIIVENDDDPQIQTIEEDSSDSLEEKELRLIALKSAVLKKHMERKKRNAELAYSPTDFDDMLKFGVLENDIKSDIEVDLEGEDSQTPELISSPLASPKLLLSPQYIDDGEDSQQQMVDTKPVDMDIASSDSEQVEVFNEFRPVVQQQQQQPSSLSTLSLSSNELPFGIQHQDYAFSLYVSGLKVEPLPPGVEYYEEIVPPPPPFHQENLGVQEMEVENQENPEDESSAKNNKNPTIIEQKTLEVKELSSCEEEEELALRALLLAKFQSPRNKKRKLDAESKDTANVNSKNETNEILKTNISSEWILKEAVRRFKLNKHLNKDTVDSKNSPFKENSVIVQSSPELVQMQYKEAEEEEKEVVVESFSFSDDVANSKLTENEIPQKWTLPKHNTSREMHSFSKSGDNEERKETSKASGAVEEASAFTNLQTIHPPIDEVMDLIRNKYSTGNVGKPYSEECTRREESGRRDSFTKLPQNAGDHLLNALNEKLFETKDTNVDLIVTKSLEVHPVKANKETWEEKNCASNKSEESLNCTGIQEKNFDQTTKTYLPVNRTRSEEKNSPISETHVPPSEEYPIESKSLEKPAVVDIPFNPSFGESEVNTNEFMRSVMNTNDPSDREPKNKISKQEHFQEEDASMVKKDTLNSAITTSAFAKVSSKANQETKAVSKELKSNQASAKVIHKNLAKKYQNKLKVVNKITSTATALRKQQSNILPTYSVLKTTKIVKPNKVINKNVDMKPIQNNIQNLMEIKSDICTSPTASQVKQTRLITSKEQVKSMCQVPKLVINLQRSSSSTETSASEAENYIGDDHDYLCRPAEDYNDNASPISLIMESPRSHTPNRSNSPTGKCPEKNQQQFEEKLDSFLKSVRSKVQEQVISLQKTPQAERVMGNQATKANNNNTPVAVRHLPAAAQEEYRRLVHRMKLLEAQRKTLTTDTETSDLFTSKDDDLSIVPNSSASTATSASLGQNNLCKQVLIKNANSNTKSSPSDTEKPSRSMVLSSYENTFAKIGTGIITNLDKSLNLLEEAKNAKLSKLRLEKRLKVLKAEIDLVQTQHREEQHKISSIYPNICKTNDVIMTLKQKRSKIFKLAVNLGKSLKGQDYRLNNDLKQNIIEKSKQLAEEIKLVNSLKLQNIEKFIEPTEGTKNNEDNKEEPSPPTNNDEEQSLQVSTTTFQKGDNRELQDESLPQKNDNIQEEVEIFDHEEKKSLAANYYVSPLNNLNSGNSDLDPQGVLCPYDLMGHCEDKNCSYVHLTENFRKE